jgi:hypothetical protein
MKRLFLPAVLALSAVFLTACGDPAPRNPQRPGRVGFQETTSVVDEPVRETTTSSTRQQRETTVVETESTPPPPPPPTAAVTVGNYEYGKPVPGKTGFVTSPYAPASGYVDVRGFPPGTEVKDPYSGKIFLVP